MPRSARGLSGLPAALPQGVSHRVLCYDVSMLGLAPKGSSNAHFDLGDFDGGHGFDSCSGRSPDLWRELSFLPAVLRHGRGVRYRLLL
jgi:hypothetical protein